MAKTGTHPSRPRHLLLADDGSKGAARARALALAIAAAAGARLTVVYVREPTESPDEALRKLAAVRRAAAAAGQRCDTVIERPVGITSPGRRILTVARQQGVDLIVVGARRARIMRRLLGSVSRHVVSHALVSVCVVR